MKLRTLVSSITRKRKTPDVMPAHPGVYVALAYPPPGGTLVRPRRGDSSLGFERVSTRAGWVSDESDRWADPDDWIVAEYEMVLVLENPNGSVYRTRDVAD